MVKAWSRLTAARHSSAKKFRAAKARTARCTWTETLCQVRKWRASRSGGVPAAESRKVCKRVTATC